MFAIFASYSTVDGGREFKKFLTRLHDLVERKTTWASRKISFWDKQSLKLADEWNPKLAEALRTSAVLICFVSPRYLQSIWCGRELAVFKQRRTSLGKAGTDCRFVFPLIWELMPGTEWPLPLRQYQYRSEELPEGYLKHGLRQLINLRPKQGEKLLEMLTDALRDELRKPAKLPEGEPFKSFEDVDNLFSLAPRPYDVWLTVVAAQGSQWIPPGAPADVGEIVDQRAGISPAVVHLLPAEPGFALRAAQACKERQVVICVVDGSLAPAHAPLQELNQEDVPHLVLLVVDVDAAKGKAPISITQWCQAFGPGSFAQALSDGRAAACLPTTLTQTLDPLVTKVRQKVQLPDSPTKVEAPLLESERTEQGNPCAVIPVLAGPGQGAQA